MKTKGEALRVPASGKNGTARNTRAIVVLAAMLICLVTCAAAGAHGIDQRPAEPAHDAPAASWLSGPLQPWRGSKNLWASWAASIWSHWASFNGWNAGRGGGGGNSGGGNGGGGTSGGVTLGSAAPGAIGAKALVLYDTTGQYGWLGELYATAVGNLASHFGTWKAEPVSQYTAGQIGQYTATIYVGSTYDEALPSAFLDDVYNATHPVIWMYDNIWQLTNRYSTTFQAKYGWMWSQFDLGTVSHVIYKGVSLTRDGVDNQAGIMNYSAVDPTKATTLAYAVHDSDGSQFPWALRSGSLTYLGENPFVYTNETDRLRVFEDLLYDALNPFASTQHRALLRLEDINPNYDATALKAAADYLYSQHVPYGFGVSPIYLDPTGYYNSGKPQTVRLSERGNTIASLIKYMQARRGTLVMHGTTHQYSNVPNPYTGVTDDDFEFYRVTTNPDNTLNFQGPVPEDSAAWASARIDAGLQEFARAGVGTPTIFEFPHYGESAVDAQVVAQKFPTKWERSMYFGGILTGGTPDYTHKLGQMFPYVVRDAYGTVVLPENLGDYEPEPFYQFPVHLVSDILAGATAESVVRNGIAGVYFHPFEGVTPLSQIVTGLRAAGWTFVSPSDVATTG